MRKQLNKNTNTSSQKYNEKYCKIKNNLNDEYKSYVYKLISLLVSICVIMIIALLILIIKKNVILSYILLTIIPILAFYTLDKITIKHKEKKEAYVIEYRELLNDIPRKKRNNYLYPKIEFNMFNNKINRIICFFQKHTENISHNTTMISIIFVVDLVIPKLFPNCLWFSIISYFILLMITAFITTKIENKRKKQTNLIINLIFLNSFIALSLLLGISLGNTNNFGVCIKDTLEICNLAYCAFGMLTTCFNIQN